MAKTLNVLIQEVRNMLGDLTPTYTFSDAQLTDFINQAIRDLSQHFPRRVEYSLATTAAEHYYDLEIGHTAILSCEYPGGEQPPRYLQRRDFTHKRFWLSDGYYDFIKPADSDSLNPPQLVISASPAAAETILLWLNAEHAELADGADECSVAERFLHLIGLFVRWKCWQELSTTEGMDPSPLTTLAFTVEINARRAEESYRNMLQTAQVAQTDSGLVAWEFDKFDPLV